MTMSARLLTGGDTHRADSPRRWLLCAAILAIASCGIAAGSASASEISQLCPLGFGSSVQPRSESAAQADAASLLAELPLPPGSSESATEPAEDDSLLAHPGEGPPATPNAVDEHAWWLMPLAPVEALDYICTHLPAGTISTTIFESGISGPNVPENGGAAFALPGTPGTLVIWAVRLTNGSTALRADAQVVWITPRSPSETIPSGAQLLRISAHSTSRRPGRLPESEELSVLERLPWTVTSARQIEAVVALLNALRVIQPGLRLCPLSLGETSVQLSFYATPDAPALALADIEPGGCGGVSLTIGGVPQPPLEGGWSLISEIGKALSVNPAAGPPVGLTPRLSGVRMSRKRFDVDAEDIVTVGVEPGTEFLFDLSAPAEVHIAISRLPRGSRYADTCLAAADRPRLRSEGCRRTAVVDRFTRLTEPEGQDAIPFSGFVGRHALTIGRYVAVLRARNSGGRSRLTSVEFEITR
jgi:hypothetical protein